MGDLGADIRTALPSILSPMVAGLVLSFVAGCEPAGPAVSSDPTPPSAHVTPAAPHLAFVRAPEGDVASVVRGEASRSQGTKLVVYVGATWCEPCRRFHEAAESGSLDAQLPPARFLEFDLDRDGDRLSAAGYSTEYIPLFVVPGPDGRATSRRIEGSIKGPGAPQEISPRLRAILTAP